MRVSNVEEAVALARKLKQDGEYDWFRGQIREWDPASSLERKVGDDHAKLQDYREKLARFIGWVGDQEGLSYLAKPANMNAMFAILQHYGFPTCYIDFSTDPSIAGFFASDCDSPPDGDGMSVIYCLNTGDLKKFYDGMSSTHGDLNIDFVDVDVRNLWRLHAQHGKFLYVNHNWYSFYPMDRIVFPWGGCPADPPRELIYPIHKSHLEIVLDQYFQLERQRESHMRALEMAQTGVGFKFLQLAGIGEAHYASLSFRKPLDELQSWKYSEISGWSQQPEENFEATVGKDKILTLRKGDAAPKPSAQIYHAVLGLLDRERTLRSRAVDWRIGGEFDAVGQEKLSEYIRSAWNGMRNLPFKNEDIASAFASLAEICVIEGRASNYSHEIIHAFRTWVPDAMEVDFGTLAGAGSRGYCSQSAMVDALDESWLDAWHDRNGEVSLVSAFQACYNPRLMFDFDKFRSLFARQIIPSQIARERDLILFNPAEVSTFGLP